MRLAELVQPAGLARLRAEFPSLDLGPVEVRSIASVLERLCPGVAGITIGHRIWVKRTLVGEADDLLVLLVHELVHVQQWRRLGPIGFLVRYGCDYMGSRLRLRSHHAAYQAIPAEAEARSVAESFRAPADRRRHP